MYLNASTDKLEILLGGSITTNQLQWSVSWQDVTSAGMTLPQSAGAGLSNNTTQVDIVSAPSASTTRQVTNINIYNADTVAATVIVQKDVSGTNYVLVKSLLQVGDTLMWSREDGWRILSSSSQESVILREFTANGTWTKPAGLKRIIVCCVGAGGGGGSGRRDAAGTTRSGGGGGGGGAIVWRNLSSSDLTSTVTVTTGTGGTGATGQTADTTNGITGGTGGDTSFGAFVIAKGGSGGGGGTNASGASGQGGSLVASTPSYGPYALGGATGGAGQSASSGTPSSGMSSTAAAGGGGGNGISSANASSTTAGNGGGLYQNGIFINGPTAGATPNGLAAQSNYLFFNTNLASVNGLGTGGAGGYHTSYPTFINGGNGGNYGAAGGGGSASVNGTTSGAGGNGAGGLCVVMEIY